MQRLEEQKRELEQELQTLETDPHYLALVHAEAVRKQIAQTKARLHDVTWDIRREQERNRAAVDERILQRIRQYQDEKERVGKLIRTEGVIERNFLGGGRGYSDTNELKIK